MKRERESRQLDLIIHNLAANEGEAHKTAHVKHVTDILKFLGAKVSVTKPIKLGKKSRLLKVSVDTL